MSQKSMLDWCLCIKCLMCGLWGKCFFFFFNENFENLQITLEAHVYMSKNPFLSCIGFPSLFLPNYILYVFQFTSPIIIPLNYISVLAFIGLSLVYVFTLFTYFMQCMYNPRRTKYYMVLGISLTFMYEGNIIFIARIIGSYELQYFIIW